MPESDGDDNEFMIDNESDNNKPEKPSNESENNDNNVSENNDNNESKKPSLKSV